VIRQSVQILKQQHSSVRCCCYCCCCYIYCWVGIKKISAHGPEDDASGNLANSTNSHTAAGQLVVVVVAVPCFVWLAGM
jgi:hypothetical protein